MRAWFRTLPRSARQGHPSRKIRRQHQPRLAGLGARFFESLEDRTVLSADISGISMAQTSPAAPAHAVPGELITYTITVPNAAAATTSTTDTFVSFNSQDGGETVVGATASHLAPGSSIQVDGVSNIVSADLGAIAPGSNATLTVTVLIKASGLSAAQVFANVWSPQDKTFNTAANTKDSNVVSTTLDPVPAAAPNVSVVMSGPSIANLGAQITYTIKLNNTSAANAASNVAFIDRLDPNETFVSATDTAGTSYTFNAATGQITGTVASIGTSSTDTVTVVAASTNAAKATGSVTNAALVSIAAGNAGSPSSATLQTGFPADISGITVAQTSPAAPGHVLPGQLITYTITVPNAAAAAGNTTDVNVTDVLPAGETVITATAGLPSSPIPVTINRATNTVTSDLGAIARGASQTLTITALVGAGAGPTLNNSASVWSPQDAVFNTAANQKTSNTVSTTVDALPAGAANVSVSQSGPASGAAFDTLTYTVTLTNHSSTAAASNVAFVEQLDPNALFFSASDTAGTRLTFNSVTGQVTGTVASIASSSGDTVKIVVVPNFLAANAGSITNAGFVSIPAGNSGSPTAASTTTTVTSPAGPANIALDIGEQATSVTAGGVIEYDTSLINQSATAATNVAFSLQLDPNNRLVSISDTNHTSFTLVNSVVTGTVASIPGNGADHITILVIPTAAALTAGSVTDSELIAAPGGNTGPSTDSATTTVVAAGAAQANVKVAKVAPQTGTVGAPVTDTITLTNSGSAAVSNASLVDLLGANVSNVSATDAAGDTFTFANGQLAGTVASLPVGATTVTVVYTPAAAGTFADTALLGIPGGNQAANSSNGSTTVSAATPPSLTIAKTGSPSTISVGDTETYTITVANSGGTAATGAVVTDVVPAGLTLVSATDAAGTVTISGNTVTDNLGTVAASSGSETLTITATAAALPSGTTSTTVTNTANLAFGGTTTPSNSVNTTINSVTPATGVGFLAGVPGDGTSQTFVHNLYRELLGREPDSAGNTFWVNYLTQHNNAAGQAQVIQGFMNSSEYAIHYVTTLYQVILDRAPDAPGLQYWASKMGTPGTPAQNSASADEKGVVAAFFGSNEFYIHSGNTAQSWINALYEDILGRAPDGSGAAFWANELTVRGAANRDGIVSDLLTTPEAAHFVLDSFYPAVGGTSGHPLPAPGSPAGSGSTELATITGDGWENLYLQGPFDSQPQGNDGFFNSLAGGAAWDEVQLLLLESNQFYTNPNRPLTA